MKRTATQRDTSSTRQHATTKTSTRGSNTRKVPHEGGRSETGTSDDPEPSPRLVWWPGRLAKALDVNRSTLWRWERDGYLPPRIKIGPGAGAWPDATIQQWLKRRGADMNVTPTG